MEANNNATLEALEAINCIDTRGLKYLLCELVEADIFDGGLINKTISAAERAKRALSKPRRNCDVGTAKEQSERYNNFCCDHRTYEKCCGDCPLNGEPCCEIAWEQMPYEGDNDGSK